MSPPRPDAAPEARVQTPSTETIDRERHSRIARWFEELCTLEGAERLQRLEEMRREDRIGVRMLKELLELDAEGGSPLDHSHTPTAEQLPARIGDYRPIEEIGSGGMAVVLLAEQDNPRREVALKVLRHSPWSSAGTSRFEREATALGRLNHPGIAQVFEAGTQRDGSTSLAFLAMEWVPGVRLSEWAAGASIESRLRALAQIADAVHYAHTQGVIHRDLKPSNVMVTPEGQPKVLDFGVARISNAEEVPAEDVTRSGEVVGTLQYMAPEQACADGDAIDERSDVYALGMIAYEILGGRLPYETGQLPVHRAAERIAKVEPMPLGKIDPRLSGDIQTIVGRALAKDAERRYPSAREFGDDLRRHLDHKPIQARPTSLLYRGAKFVARNRLPVFLGSVTFLALVAAAVGMSWKAREAEAFAKRSQQSLQRSREVGRLLVEIFETIDPKVDGPEARVLDMIRRAEQSLLGPGRPPLVNASLHYSLGVAYGSMGDHLAAEHHYRAAVRLFEENEAEDWELAQARISLAGHVQSHNLEEPEAIERHLDVALETARRVHPPEHPSLLYLRSRRAMFEWYYGDRSEVLRELREVHAIGERNYPPGDPIVPNLRRPLVLVLTALGQFEEAEDLIERSISTIEELHGPDDFRIALEHQAYSELLLEMGRFEEAKAQARATLAFYENSGYTNALQRGRCLHFLASACLSLGQFEEALQHLDSATELLGTPAENLSLSTVTIAITRSALYVQQGDVERAKTLHEELVQIDAESLGLPLETRARLRDSIGIVASWEGDLEAAYENQRMANEMRRASPGTTPLDLASALFNEGTLLRRLGRPEDAIEPVAEALAIESELRGPHHPYALEAQFELAMIHALLDDSSQAPDLLALAQEGFDATFGPESPQARMVRDVSGFVFVDNGRYEEALVILEQSLALDGEPPDSTARFHAYAAEAEHHLGRTEAAWERLEPELERARQAGWLVAGNRAGEDLFRAADLVLSALGRTDEAAALAERFAAD